MATTDLAADAKDEMTRKGATEDDGRNPNRVDIPSGELGHRDQNKILKDNDTDFPEPDAKAEISGH